MKLNYSLIACLSLILWLCPHLSLHAQAPDGQVNSVPFLRYTPDSRAAAMGDAGVAMTPDGHTASINGAKLPFMQYTSGLSVSYNPWLKSLNADIHLSYLSAYHKLSVRNSLAASVRYFSLGEVQLSDIDQQSLGIFYPHEFAVDGTFARKFGPHFALSGTLRYISSQLMGLNYNSGVAKASTAVSTDIAAFYQVKTQLIQRAVIFGAGVNLSNLGHKIGAASGSTAYFLPANLKLGTALAFLLPDDDRFSIALDLNKPLIPDRLSAGQLEGLSVLSAMARSFTDAQGNIIKELKDVDLSLGAEYLLRNALALRIGYSYQNPDQGNRSYFSLGAGLKYEKMGLDLAYIAASQEKSPLANSLRFSVHFNFNPLPR